MYLRTLELENVKLIDRLSLSFEHKGQPRMWTVLVARRGASWFAP